MKSTKFATSSLGFIFKLERESKKALCCIQSTYQNCALCVWKGLVLCEGSQAAWA